MIDKNDLIEIYIWESNSIFTDDDERIQQKTSVPFFSKFNQLIKTVSCGFKHAGFLTDSGTIYTIGSNENGRLGIGKLEVLETKYPCKVQSLAEYTSKELVCGFDNTYAILSTGELYNWGKSIISINDESDNQFLPTKIINNTNNYIQKFKSISSGINFAMMIDEDNDLYAYGISEHGELGTGNNTIVKYPSKLMTLNEKIKQVSCGYFHTLILTCSEKVYSCGLNDKGQLGIGNYLNSSIPLEISLLRNQAIQKIFSGYNSTAINSEGHIFVWGPQIETRKNLINPKIINSSERKFSSKILEHKFQDLLDESQGIYLWGVQKDLQFGKENFENRFHFLKNIPVNKKNYGKLTNFLNSSFGFVQISKKHLPKKNEIEDDKNKRKISFSFLDGIYNNVNSKIDFVNSDLKNSINDNVDVTPLNKSKSSENEFVFNDNYQNNLEFNELRQSVINHESKINSNQNVSFQEFLLEKAKDKMEYKEMNKENELSSEIFGSNNLIQNKFKFKCSEETNSDEKPILNKINNKEPSIKHLQLNLKSGFSNFSLLDHNNPPIKFKNNQYKQRNLIEKSKLKLKTEFVFTENFGSEFCRGKKILYPKIHILNTLNLIFKQKKNTNKKLKFVSNLNIISILEVAQNQKAVFNNRSIRLIEENSYQNINENFIQYKNNVDHKMNIENVSIDHINELNCKLIQKEKEISEINFQFNKIKRDLILNESKYKSQILKLKSIIEIHILNKEKANIFKDCNSNGIGSFNITCLPEISIFQLNNMTLNSEFKSIAKADEKFENSSGNYSISISNDSSLPNRCDLIKMNENSLIYSKLEKISNISRRHPRNQPLISFYKTKERLLSTDNNSNISSYKNSTEFLSEINITNIPSNNDKKICIKRRENNGHVTNSIEKNVISNRSSKTYILKDSKKINRINKEDIGECSTQFRQNVSQKPNHKKTKSYSNYISKR